MTGDPRFALDRAIAQGLGKPRDDDAAARTQLAESIIDHLTPKETTHDDV